MHHFLWPLQAPVSTSSFDPSDWKGIIGTLIGALLGFSLGLLRTRIDEKRTASKQAAAAALACLERLGTIPGNRTISPELLSSLQLDVAHYRVAMLSNRVTRERHLPAYETVRDLLDGLDDESLSTAIGRLKATL